MQSDESFSVSNTLSGPEEQKPTTVVQHIHDKLIAQAKVKLSTTHLAVGEIADDLGFEYPQSFSRLSRPKPVWHCAMRRSTSSAGSAWLGH